MELFRKKVYNTYTRKIGNIMTNNQNKIMIERILKKINKLKSNMKKEDLLKYGILTQMINNNLNALTKIQDRKRDYITEPIKTVKSDYKPRNLYPWIEV